MRVGTCAGKEVAPLGGVFLALVAETRPAAPRVYAAGPPASDHPYFCILQRSVSEGDMNAVIWSVPLLRLAAREDSMVREAAMG